VNEIRKYRDVLPQKEKSKGAINMSVLMVSRGTAGNTCPFPHNHKSGGGKEVKGWGIPVE